MGILFKLLLGVTALASLALVLLVAGIVPPGSSGAADARDATPTADARAAEARSVAARFLRALDREDFAGACALISRRFYRRHHVPDRTQCALGLRAAMGGAVVRFRLLGVELGPRTARVRARVDGARGTITLVREGRSYRVDGLRGA